MKPHSKLRPLLMVVLLSLLSASRVKAAQPPSVRNLESAPIEIDSAANRLVEKYLESKSFPFVYLNGQTGVVCPVQIRKKAVRLLVIAVEAKSIMDEPSETCKRWIDARIDLDSLELMNRLLSSSSMDLPNKNQILKKLEERLAFQRFGLLPEEFDALLVNTETLRDLSWIDKFRRLQIMEERQLNSLTHRQ